MRVQARGIPLANETTTDPRSAVGPWPPARYSASPQNACRAALRTRYTNPQRRAAPAGPHSRLLAACTLLMVVLVLMVKRAAGAVGAL